MRTRLLKFVLLTFIAFALSVTAFAQTGAPPPTDTPLVNPPGAGIPIVDPDYIAIPPPGVDPVDASGILAEIPSDSDSTSTSFINFSLDTGIVGTVYIPPDPMDRTVISFDMQSDLPATLPEELEAGVVFGNVKVAFYLPDGSPLDSPAGTTVVLDLPENVEPDSFVLLGYDAATDTYTEIPVTVNPDGTVTLPFDGDVDDFVFVSDVTPTMLNQLNLSVGALPANLLIPLFAILLLAGMVVVRRK